DPTIESDGAHGGAEGQLTLHVFNDSLSFNQTVSVNLTGTQRDSGATFDAFGMGVAGAGASSADSTKHVDVFMDNVSYTGQQAPPTITVSAADASASEQGQDPGVFTITPSSLGSAFVVNYSMSGTATNNTDYSTLNGTVTIPSGSSSVNVT